MLQAKKRGLRKHFSYFFYGTVHGFQELEKGACVLIDRTNFVVSSMNDKGLECLVVGEKYLIVVKKCKIVTIYRAPSINVIRSLEKEESNEKKHVRHRPFYPAGFIYMSDEQKNQQEQRMAA